jgi:hypothetical protein
VVKKHAFTNFGSGVNFDTCEPAREVRDETPQPFEAQIPAAMRHTMQQYCVQTGVARQHFPAASSGRVAVQDALNIRA